MVYLIIGLVVLVMIGVAVDYFDRKGMNCNNCAQHGTGSCPWHKKGQEKACDY